jgi:hypothetical protein
MDIETRLVAVDSAMESNQIRILSLEEEIQLNQEEINETSSKIKEEETKIEIMMALMKHRALAKKGLKNTSAPKLPLFHVFEDLSDDQLAADLQRRRDEKGQLRQKEGQLRKEKEQLRNEKEQLRQKEGQLREEKLLKIHQELRLQSLLISHQTTGTVYR